MKRFMMSAQIVWISFTRELIHMFILIFALFSFTYYPFLHLALSFDRAMELNFNFTIPSIPGSSLNFRTIIQLLLCSDVQYQILMKLNSSSEKLKNILTCYKSLM